ncbi:23S rRNA (guanosine(2251)-2'-O)-methyltransferase RlmB [Sulfurovum sp. bin170]|uniref:23S rRNA (guanosine(2251)-2'-O)-methyltransferase RlmB n=1 Tax=Sulfurovum sp. bin170 TaxID=2695268 RepID=UPI0013DED8EE|nr:23S rRNA (guanosine(2251)-2'-O)-methyltransferase RlmB [Sulfurovum sp. bin170]NEW59976.1 23S rRNA (guanosine(2251)-2'-O)-methyltransferase RlmB [Sulfurovum sp. bin170]
MIIYGKQVCLHALSQHEPSVKTVYIAKKGILPQKLYDKYKSRIKFLENKWAQSMAKGGNHQGILVEMEEFAQSDLTAMKQNSFVLVLDSLTDTGNIGAIVRTAYALGVDGIIASGVKSLNFASIVRTSSGALLDMPFVIIPNVLDVINELKQVDFRIYGASMGGASINSCKFTTKRVLLLGSEGEGISKRAKSKIDEIVSIEMQREFDSLNVSAAAAILIDRMRYEV